MHAFASTVLRVTLLRVSALCGTLYGVNACPATSRLPLTEASAQNLALAVPLPHRCRRARIAPRWAAAAPPRQEVMQLRHGVQACTVRHLVGWHFMPPGTCQGVL
jgi:hypothetical protein